MVKGRSVEVDIADKAMQTLLELNCGMPSDADSVCKYSNVNVRARGRWNDLYPHRGMLCELCKLSGGFGLHQVNLARQCRAFLTSCHIAATLADGEAVAYRIRTMISHCRDHKQHDRRPGPRYHMMTAVLDFIPKEIAQLEPSSPAPRACSPPPCAHPQDLVDAPCLQDGGWVSSGSDIDMLESELFETPKKMDVSGVLGETPMKTAAVWQFGVVDEAEIDALLNDGVSPVAPTAQQYKMMKKPAAKAMKKPAAKVMKVMRLDVTVDDPMRKSLRKKVYSAGYHRAMDKAIKLGEGENDMDGGQDSSSFGGEGCFAVAGIPLTRRDSVQKNRK